MSNLLDLNLAVLIYGIQSEIYNEIIDATNRNRTVKFDNTIIFKSILIFEIEKAEKKSL